MDAAHFRATFPVLERIAYLNAGTCGPLPAVAHQAVLDAWRFSAEQGRGASDYFGQMMPLFDALRERYAGLLHAPVAEVALTTGTSAGCGAVVAGLELGPGDEILTADDEHPGLTGPLIAAREQRGVTVRGVPLAEIPGAVTDTTRLIACSHVSWHSGAVAPIAEIVAAARQRDIPVLLDGAQGVGAIDVDVTRLGVDFYAGSGQKWLCGPVGCGMLWIADAYNGRVASPAPGYGGLVDTAAGLDSALHRDARRHDVAPHGLATFAGAVAAFDVLAEHGFPALHERATGLAAKLADALRDAGCDVVGRGDSTLVSWTVPGGDAEAEAQRDRLQEHGVVIRNLPGAGRLRASVGAWNDEDDLDRLLAALA